MEVNCMDKFKYLTDRFFDFLKFVWKNEREIKVYMLLDAGMVLLLH